MQTECEEFFSSNCEEWLENQYRKLKLSGTLRLSLKLDTTCAFDRDGY